MNISNYNIKFYKVGGCVRDEILGILPKDIDYTVVITSSNPNIKISISDGLQYLEEYLETNGYKIFLKNINTFTYRAKNTLSGEVADFVLARHELFYTPDSRTPIVILGTLEQDLERRDFTINAMAKSESGKIIDLFGGQDDLANKILRTPLNPIDTMTDDPLRIFRAFRFSITKELELDTKLFDAFKNIHLYEKLWKVVSVERIREELNKMFCHNTSKSLELLVKFSQEIKYVYPTFLSDLFEKTGLWLKPTTENPQRSKYTKV